MKRISYGLIGAAFMLALLASGAAAGEVTTDANKIKISGGIQVTHFYQNEELVDVLEHNPDGVPGNADDDDSLAATLLVWNLRFEAELADNIKGVIQFEAQPCTPRAPQDDGGVNQYQSAIGIDVQDLMEPELGECYIEANEFLSKKLSIRVGIQNLVYDLRGDGNAFFLDLRGSELAFVTPLTENFGGTAYWDSNNSNAAWYGANWGEEYRSYNYHAGGLRLTYRVDENLTLDFAFMTIRETVLNHSDEYLYLASLDYNIPGAETDLGKSAFHAILAANTHDTNRFAVWTLGAGLDYFVNRFEIYGEIYGQWGDYGEVFTATTGQWEDIDHSAFAGRIGLKYNFQTAHKPWLELAVWYLSGDDGDLDDSSPSNEDFVSLEDVDDFLVMEDNLVGLDLDSNYLAIKVYGGVNFGLRGDDDTELIFQYGYFQTVTEPNRVGQRAGRPDLDIDGDLGHEIDLKIVWSYSDNLKFHLMGGYLFGAEFFEYDDDRNPGGYRVDGDSMFVILIGTTLKF